MTAQQGARGIAIFWLILFSCSIPAIAVFTVPLLVFVLWRFMLGYRRQKRREAALLVEVRRAQLAARMKAWR